MELFSFRSFYFAQFPCLKTVRIWREVEQSALHKKALSAFCPVNILKIQLYFLLSNMCLSSGDASNLHYHCNFSSRSRGGCPPGPPNGALPLYPAGAWALDPGLSGFSFGMTCTHTNSMLGTWVCPGVSQDRSVPGPKCPTPEVSQVRCPRINVSQDRCVPGPKCPRPEVSQV